MTAGVRSGRGSVAIALAALALAGCTAVDGRPAGREPGTVLIDVGHTPEAPGTAAASGAPEYAFNARFAAALADRLRARGRDAAVLRIADPDPLLDRRVAAIAAARACLTLSIHHDSVQERYLQRRIVNGVAHMATDHAAGFSLFVPADTHAAARSLAAAQAVADALTARGERPSPHHAEPIAGESRRLLDPARGVYAGDFLKTIRTAKTPIVLLEVGVIKNPVEEARLSDPAVISGFAEAVAAAATALPCP